jgi:hypothetical protein
MDFHFASFAPDPCELTHASVQAAHLLLREKRPDLPAVMAEVGGSFLRFFGDRYTPLLKQTQDALALSFVRMASRHGAWGSDFHAYHNEEHALELLNGRLARTRLQLGWAGLEAEEWLLLALFSTCHDLRQREQPSFENGVGANERASIAETHRILRCCGFDLTRHKEYFETLCWMIAGSTFDARPEPPNAALNSATVVNSGGSLSTKLARDFINEHPGYRDDPILRRRARLILISADMDTANVGEPFMALVTSAVRLVKEREMRAGRPISGSEGVAAAADVLEFLTEGQERYFFKLHRFVSDVGRDVFGLGKTLNSPKLKRLTDAMRARFTADVLRQSSGAQVIDGFIELAQQIAG